MNSPHTLLVVYWSKLIQGLVCTSLGGRKPHKEPGVGPLSDLRQWPQTFSHSTLIGASTILTAAVQIVKNSDFSWCNPVGPYVQLSCLLSQEFVLGAGVQVHAAHAQSCLLEDLALALQMRHFQKQPGVRHQPTTHQEGKSTPAVHFNAYCRTKNTQKMKPYLKIIPPTY